MPTAFPIPPTGLNYLSTSASALVKTGAGQCHLILITASTAGTVKLWDAVSRYWNGHRGHHERECE
jgi:hypothetical protein